MDCKAMLESAFAHAKKKTLNSGAEATVFATVTIHTQQDIEQNTEYGRDAVWYGNGKLGLDFKDGEEVLTGTFNARSNGRDKGGAMWPYNPSTNIELTVSRSGKVTIQRLIGGKKFMNRGPVTYDATCKDGLLTGLPAWGEKPDKSPGPVNGYFKPGLLIRGNRSRGDPGG